MVELRAVGLWQGEGLVHAALLSTVVTIFSNMRAGTWDCWKIIVARFHPTGALDQPSRGASCKYLLICESKETDDPTPMVGFHPTNGTSPR